MSSEPRPARETAQDAEASAENPLSTLCPDEARVLQAVQLRAPALRETDRPVLTDLLRRGLILTWVLDRQAALGVQYCLTPQGRHKLRVWTVHQRLNVAPQPPRPGRRSFASLPLAEAPARLDWRAPVLAAATVPALIGVVSSVPPEVGLMLFTGLLLAGLWFTWQRRHNGGQRSFQPRLSQHRLLRHRLPAAAHQPVAQPVTGQRPTALPALFTELLTQIDSIELAKEDISSAYGYALRHLPEKAHEAVQTFLHIPHNTQAHAEARQEVEAQLRLILARLTQAREEQAQAELDRLRELRALIEV